MSNRLPPPSPKFNKGVTYTGRGPDSVERSSHRVLSQEYVRGLGNLAAQTGAVPIGPGFLQRVHEQVRHQEAERQENLRMYAFPVSGSELRTVVTERSSNEAVRLYETVQDRMVHEIIDTTSGVDDTPAESVQVMLRSDDMLRVRLGTYLRDKLEKYPVFWGFKNSRVERNIDKNPPLGYERMPSRDYVVQLALSLMDGTFKPEDQTFIEIGRDGTYVDGEHRTAAYRLLRFDVPADDTNTAS